MSRPTAAGRIRDVSTEEGICSFVAGEPLNSTSNSKASQISECGQPRRSAPRGSIMPEFNDGQLRENEDQRE